MQKNDEGESNKNETLRMTIWWLKENYEYSEEVSIPRKIIYGNYARFCEQYHCLPISSATFGKIIRQQFPQITTRRLGTRGQSKYHYHGLAIKTTSIDFNPAFSKCISINEEIQAFNTLHPKNRNEFTPSITISTLKYDDSVDEGIKSDLNNFLVMYQTHSQQILDSIIQGSFEEVEKFLSSFWRSCPSNFNYLFNNPKLISSVIHLDIQVYINVSKSVLSSMNQSLPETYLKDFVIFLCNIYSMLKEEISNSNYELKKRKLKYALLFKEMCLAWLKASHLFQIIFPVLKNTEIISQILEDFQNVDLDEVILHVIRVIPSFLRAEFINHFQYYFEELENILEKELSLDNIINWCEKIYNQEWTKDHKNLCLVWSSFLSIFINNLFLQKSESFAHIRLIFMWMEYLLYIQCILTEFQHFNVFSMELDTDEESQQFNFTKVNKIDYNFCPINIIPTIYDIDALNGISDGNFHSEDTTRKFFEEYNESFNIPILEDNVKIFWNI